MFDVSMPNEVQENWLCVTYFRERRTAYKSTLDQVFTKNRCGLDQWSSFSMSWVYRVCSSSHISTESCWVNLWNVADQSLRVIAGSPLKRGSGISNGLSPAWRGDPLCDCYQIQAKKDEPTTPEGRKILSKTFLGHPVSYRLSKLLKMKTQAVGGWKEMTAETVRDQTWERNVSISSRIIRRLQFDPRELSTRAWPSGSSLLGKLGITNSAACLATIFTRNIVAGS